MQGIFSQKGGILPARQECTLINRTGATLTRGDVVGVNLSFVDTYVGINPDVNADGATGWVLGAAVAVTTEIAARVCVVFDRGTQGAATCLDNETGIFVVEGQCTVKMNGANKGEFLRATNAQVYASPETLTEAAALTVSGKYFGWALEDTSGATTGQAIWSGFYGVGTFGGDT